MVLKNRFEISKISNRSEATILLSGFYFTSISFPFPSLLLLANSQLIAQGLVGDAVDGEGIYVLTT